MKSKTIIFEGPDGGGKSFAAAKMAERLNLEIIYNGAAPANMTESTIRINKSILDLQLEAPKVMDRADFISAAIYSPLMFKTETITMEEAAAAILKFEPIIFYCRPPDRVFFSKRNKRKENQERREFYDFIENNKLQIIDLYDEFFSKWVKPFGVIK